MEGARHFLQINLRVPEKLKGQLQCKAVENRRSLNAEIVVLLEEALKQDEQSEKATRMAA